MYYAMRIAALAILAAAGLGSLHLMRADLEFRRRTPVSVAHAVELAPGNTEYLELRALQMDYEGADSTALLERAAQLTPLASTPRIRLGLAAETRGDYSSAEKWLLDAARIDRQFEPRWTLANFYFRRQNQPQFWTWMRFALEISYDDRRPAFDLCWRVSDDSGEILNRAIPDRHEVLAAYLGYLLETHRPIEAAAMKLSAAHDSTDRDLLLAACDALIAAHDAPNARALWQAIGLGEVGFHSPRVRRGFDWQFVDSPGVVHLEIDQPRPMHRVALNGKQPESCDLLRRVLMLEPGKHYTVRWQSQLQGIPANAGFEWRVGTQHAGIEDRQIQFTATSELTTLTLAYTRPAGQVRAEGWIEVWDVDIR
jgi:tetratricopeptide (TPR) repeat protein